MGRQTPLVRMGRVLLGLAEIDLVLIGIDLELFSESVDFLSELLVFANEIHLLGVHLNVHHHSLQLYATIPLPLQLLLQIFVFLQVNCLSLFSAGIYCVLLKHCLFNTICELKS